MKYWKYKGKVDITIGEVTNKKYLVLSIISSVVLSLIVALVIILNFDSLFPNFNKYYVKLIDDEVIVNLGEKIDLKDYILHLPEEALKFEITPKEINTSNLGEHKIVYSSYIKDSKYDSVLTIKIVDKESPILELITNEKSYDLYRDEEIECNTFVKELKDNDTNSKLELKCNLEEIDYDLDDFLLKYSVEDNSKNITEKELLLIFKDRPKVYKPVEQPQIEEGTNVANEQPTYTPPTEPEYPTDPKPPSITNNPAIYGVHDVTIAVGSSVGDLLGMLSSGVSGTGDVRISVNSVNLTIIGDYTAYFSSSDGASATATVYVR